ncbi:protein serine/threonine phosphatase [Mycolicibacterium rhodesiae JS60]|nr:protein serine/threonine phosphatase [Mycolicibacterium rhodesiae JS60]
MTGLTVTAFTDTGVVRDHNEDAVLVDSWVSQSGSGALITMHLDARTPLVCAVADGMGGHAGGELASRVALGLLAETASHWQSATDIAAALVDISAQVFRIGENPELRGLGTTLAGVCVFDDHVAVFNVGDSRVYSMTNGFLQQISVDDAVLDGQGRPMGVITQSIGQNDPVAPHVQTVPRDGASFLMCSDGVSGEMSPASLRAAALEPTAHACAASLIATVRANGAADNLSLILLDVPAVLPAPSAAESAEGPRSDQHDQPPPPAAPMHSVQQRGTP